MRHHTLMRLVALAVVLWLILRGATAAAAPSLAAIRESLIAFEGYRAVPYRDAGSWSVGAGHNLTAHGQHPKARYSRVEIEGFLMQDIAAAIDAARKGVARFDELPDQVQLVCIHIAFTCGRTGFERWTNLRRALSYRAYASATTELADSRWRNQVSATRFNWALRILRSQP